MSEIAWRSMPIMMRFLSVAARRAACSRESWVSQRRATSRNERQLTAARHRLRRQAARLATSDLRLNANYATSFSKCEGNYALSVHFRMRNYAQCARTAHMKNWQRQMSPKKETVAEPL
jgi:hypothetical protein